MFDVDYACYFDRMTSATGYMLSVLTSATGYLLPKRKLLGSSRVLVSDGLKKIVHPSRQVKNNHSEIKKKKIFKLEMSYHLVLCNLSVIYLNNDQSYYNRK